MKSNDAIYCFNGKEYHLRGWDCSNAVICQVTDTTTGEWYKKNIRLKYEPGLAWKLQKTQIKSNYNPAEFVQTIARYIHDDFNICSVIKILEHMETMKEATL